ncbi:MAG: hypothetical protein FWG57_00200 [Endomicrobia bacterium]|nr:hypothetical protein [Endomicrobiia bacterium]
MQLPSPLEGEGECPTNKEDVPASVRETVSAPALAKQEGEGLPWSMNIFYAFIVLFTLSLAPRCKIKNPSLMRRVFYEKNKDSSYFFFFLGAAFFFAATFFFGAAFFAATFFFGAAFFALHPQAIVRLLFAFRHFFSAVAGHFISVLYK